MRISAALLLWEPQMSKVLTPRATVIFKRLQRFYQIFNVIAALLSGLSLAVLTFDEFHDSNLNSSVLLKAAAGLLTSAAITAVVAVTIATMLLFKFEDYENPTTRDFAIAWIPLVLVDLVIVEFLMGMIIWYAASYPTWCVALIGLQVALMLAGTIGIAFWMWKTRSFRSGLIEGTRGAAQSEALRLEDGD